MHVPQWKFVLNHFFEFRTDLKFLELGTGNGMCSNFLLDNYNCNDSYNYGNKWLYNKNSFH